MKQFMNIEPAGEPVVWGYSAARAFARRPPLSCFVVSRPSVHDLATENVPGPAAPLREIVVSMPVNKRAAGDGSRSAPPLSAFDDGPPAAAGGLRPRSPRNSSALAPGTQLAPPPDSWEDLALPDAQVNLPTPLPPGRRVAKRHRDGDTNPSNRPKKAAKAQRPKAPGVPDTPSLRAALGLGYDLYTARHVELVRKALDETVTTPPLSTLKTTPFALIYYVLFAHKPLYNKPIMRGARL